MRIKKIIVKAVVEMLTEIDNRTADLGAFLIALTTISYVVCGIYSVFYLKQPLDWQGAGTGAGAILGASALLFRIKKPSIASEEAEEK